MSNQIQNLPVHVAITMDGNGRWATNQNLPRTAGHNEGLKVAKRIVKAASDMGIKYLTLYVFSTENWKRAQEEVGFLMNKLKIAPKINQRRMFLNLLGGLGSGTGSESLPMTRISVSRISFSSKIIVLPPFLSALSTVSMPPWMPLPYG